MVDREICCVSEAIGRRAARANRWPASVEMSSRRSRSGGIRISNVFTRKKRSSRKYPSATIDRKSRLVAQSTRTSVSIGLVSPNLRISPDSKNRSSFTWMLRFSSPNSSKNKVPVLATSNRPLWSRSAPVKAPRLWPNNSLSTKFSAKAPQLTGTNGFLPLRLCIHRVRAANSLPVPVSPVISTVESVGDTVAISLCTARIAGESPTNMLGPSAAWTLV